CSTSPPTSGSTPPTRWRSVTAATTSRCLSGPAARSRWARRSRRCAAPPTPSPCRWRSTARPSRSTAGSGWKGDGATVSDNEPASPRLVATDLDGTLLDAQGRVSGRTRAAIRALDERGVPVVFVTGRPVRWMDDLLSDVGRHGLAVCSNGGIVLDVPSASVRSALTVPRERALEVALRLRVELPGTTFAQEKTTGLAREAELARRLPSSA